MQNKTNQHESFKINLHQYRQIKIIKDKSGKIETHWDQLRQTDKKKIIKVKQEILRQIETK